MVLFKDQDISFNQTSTLQPCDEEVPGIHDCVKHIAVTKSTSQDVVLQLFKQNKIVYVWVNQRYGSNKQQPYVGEPPLF